MTKEEKATELRLLSESLKAGSITTTDFVTGVKQIVNSSESAQFAGVEKVGIVDNKQERIITVGQCSIPYNPTNKSRKLRVATYLKEHPTEIKKQTRLNKEIK